MDEKEYIETRLEDQIKWYSEKSSWNQKIYKRLQIIEIIIASLIPVLSGYSNRHWLIPILIGLSGASIAAIESITKLYKFHENWIQYRSTSEILKHEKYLYLTGSHPYGEKPFHHLVERVESIISSENINWSQLNITKKEEKKNTCKI